MLNFEELALSPDGVRYSLNGTKSLIKWDGNIIPPSVQSLPSYDGPYTIEEILPISHSSEWDIQE